MTIPDDRRIEINRETIRMLSALGIYEWDVSVNFAKLADKKGLVKRAECGADWVYQRATILYSNDLKDDENLRQTQYHECLHVVFDHLYKTVHEYIIGHLVTEEHRPLAARLYKDAEENVIERLATALVKLEKDSA